MGGSPRRPWAVVRDGDRIVARWESEARANVEMVRLRGVLANLGEAAELNVEYRPSPAHAEEQASHTGEKA